MTSPKRIQLSRAKGWRKPEGTIVVSRPSKWGNPFRFGDDSYGLVHEGPQHEARFGRSWDYEGRISGPGQRHDMWFSPDDIVKTYVRLATRAELVELFRLTITAPTWGMQRAYPSGGGRLVKFTDDELAELAGHDLACWCPLGQPCHADVLLELANPGWRP